jgi:molybdopterin-guanine dinucleotide biosynthesis protein A
MDNCVGIILAGGKSKRMGEDKSLLKFRGKTLLQRIIDEQNKILNNVYVIGKESKNFEDAIGVKDKIFDKGPIGGLFTAISEIRSEWYLITPCDMPFVSHTHLSKLLDHRNTGDFDAVIAESENGIEPLVAVYNRNIFNKMEENIKNKNYAVRFLFKQFHKKYIKFDAQIFEKDVFFNINCPDDYNYIIQNEKKKLSIK